MDLIDEILLVSKKIGIPADCMLSILENEVVQEIERVTDVEQARGNSNILWGTFLYEIASEAECKLIFRDLKLNDPQDFKSFVMIRDETKKDGDLRVEFNDYLIQLVDNAHDLRNAINKGGFLYEEKFSQEVYQKKMRELCKVDIDSAENAEQVHFILTEYLAFDFDAKKLVIMSPVYEYGLMKMIDFCLKEVDKVRCVAQLINMKAMIDSKKVGTIADNQEYAEKLHKLHDNIIAKAIILFNRDLKKTKLSNIKLLYNNLGLTGYDKKLQKKIPVVFKKRCKSESESTAVSRQVRSIRELFRDIDQNDPLYDSQTVVSLMLRNVELVDREMKEIMTTERMSKYLESNLDIYGDAGYYKNSRIVEEFYKEKIASEKSIARINEITLSIPLKFRYFVNIKAFAQDRKKQICTEAVKSAKTLKKTEEAVSLLVRGSDAWKEGQIKIDGFFIKKIEKARSLRRINSILQDRRNENTERAAAKRAIELVLPGYEVS